MDPNDLTDEEVQALRAAQVEAMTATQPVPMLWEVRSIPAPAGQPVGAYVRMDFQMVLGHIGLFLSADHNVTPEGAVDLSSVSQVEEFADALKAAAVKARSQIEVPRPGSNGAGPAEG